MNGPDGPARPAPRTLGELDLVVTGTRAGVPGLDAAWRSSRAAAAARLDWLAVPDEDPPHLRAGGPVPPGALPKAAELRALLEEAVAGCPSEVSLHLPLPDDSGDLTEARAVHRSLLRGDAWSTALDPLAVRLAAARGGLVMDRVERRHPHLADLVDDLTAVLAAPVRLVLASGRVPRGSATFDGANRALVLAVGADARVEHGGPAGGLTHVPTGHFVDVAQPLGAAADPGGVVLVAAIRMPVLADCWRYAARTAGFWPRLRADLPVDPWEPAAVYGLPEPVDVREVLRAEFTALAGEHPAEEALAYWRATLTPAPRPVALEPRVTGGTEVVGRIPGGAALLRASLQEATRLAALAGWVVAVGDDEVDDLVALVAGAAVRVRAGPDGGVAGLAADLVRCGVLTPVDGRPGTR